MALMLKNARLIDPQVGLDEVADVLIRDGVIVEVGHNLTMEKGCLPTGVTIVAPAGSTAHEYAQKVGHPFEELGK